MSFGLDGFLTTGPSDERVGTDRIEDGLGDRVEDKMIEIEYNMGDVSK